MPAPKKYPDEVRERAVRMVFPIREESGQSTGAIASVASKLGVNRETLRGSGAGQLVAATDEVRRLGGVGGQRDGPVVRRPRLRTVAQPAQQVGAGGVVGVVVLQWQTVHLRQRDLRAVEFGDRDRP